MSRFIPGPGPAEGRPCVGFPDVEPHCDVCGVVSGHTPDCVPGRQMQDIADRMNARRDSEVKKAWASSPYNPKNPKYQPRKRGQR